MEKEEKKNIFKRFWIFLKKDTWGSFVVTLLIAFIIIKFIFFPLLSLVTGTALPLVIVESCSMYHSESMEKVMQNSVYSQFNLSLENSKKWGFQNGLNKGDIIFVISPKKAKIGDVIIFGSGNSGTPIIHRIISLNPMQTKGDNNPVQLIPSNNPGRIDETNIVKEQLVGKAVFRIPYLGWLKLIFYEGSRSPEDRGLCS